MKADPRGKRVRFRYANGFECELFEDVATKMAEKDPPAGKILGAVSKRVAVKDKVEVDDDIEPEVEAD